MSTSTSLTDRKKSSDMFEFMDQQELTRAIIDDVAHIPSEKRVSRKALMQHLDKLIAEENR